ncbi:MAG TPA: serine protease [Thermoanaerobaculia bacterium]|nr:serine protease [Thermoanaerobaculia bacterium]
MPSAKNDDLRQLMARARAQLAVLGDDPLHSPVLLEAVRRETAAAAVAVLPGDDGTRGRRAPAEPFLTLPGVDAGMLAESPAAAQPHDAAPAVAASDVLRAAREAMEKVAAEGTASNLTDFQRISVEAIVQLTGRPAMRYRNGVVQSPPNDEGDNSRWRTFVATARSKINRASASVGQVGLVRGDGSVEAIGTAWRLGADLVVTNRHVAAAFAKDRTVAPSKWKLDSKKKAVVNFSATDASLSDVRFDVDALGFCADEESIDFAVFRLRAGSAAFPAALPLDFSAESVGREIGAGAAKRFEGEEVYVVGHPFRDVATAATTTVFGVADGLKRCSPGLVTAISKLEHAFEHDCSTLGGNSGSCVLSVARHRVVGLHYGGVSVNENQIGLANVALGLFRLGAHRAAEILKTGAV